MHDFESFLVNGVKFDGLVEGVLVDAKGPGYARFVGATTGTFKTWWKGSGDLLKQARRQLQAAGGTPIEWHVAEAPAAKAIEKLFADNGIEGITVTYTRGTIE